jgi:ubiquinone/menaquinone biosynthesis C-methylase UbiE
MHGRGAGKGEEPAGQPEVAYVLPRHPSEVHRLDVQHYALREALGANYLAPIQRPAFVLDSGCGTGQWSFDVGAEFPEALVVGLDVEPGKSGGPANYRFARGNLLQGLPFRDDRFDFVHQRLLFAGIPVKRWPSVVRDLVRVTRPGGWIELVEGANQPASAGPATRRLAEMLNRLARSAGVDSTGVVFRSLDDYLTRAGARAVTRRTVALPLGEWGGRIGSFMATDGRALYTRLAEVFQARFGVSDQECLELVVTAQREWEEHRATYSIAVAYGRKPG